MPIDEAAQKPLVIYHGKCQDGFTAAWACWLKHPDWEFFAGIHGNPPPDVTGREVYFLDFSYKRPVLLEMARKAKMIVIADHHASAENDLRDIDIEAEQSNDYCPMKLIFDMKHSGARLAWDLFHGVRPPEPEDPFVVEQRKGQFDQAARDEYDAWLKTARPRMIDIVEDRDLWLFNIAFTKEITSVIFSYPYKFDVWSSLSEMIESATGVQRLLVEGQAIARKQTKDIEELLEKVLYRGSFGGYDNIPIANLSYVYASEAGHIMSENEPFAVIYFETEDAYEVSLRSSEKDGLDVSRIAAHYGGGGHKNAAGCKIPKAKIDVFNPLYHGSIVEVALNFQGSVKQIAAKMTKP